MTRTLRIALALGVTLGVGAPALAQQLPPTTTQATDDKAAKPAESTSSSSLDRKIGIQYIRPQTKAGLNIFETTKVAGAEFDSFKLDWGASFTTQIQDLSHSNTSAPVLVLPAGNISQNPEKPFRPRRGKRA